jgi:hypothetical protein
VTRCLAPLALAAAALALSAAAPALDVPADVEAAVAVSDVRVADGAIEARIANRGARELRDVRLQIEYVYLWPDEMHPGDESPGRAWSHVVPGPLAPGASERILFRPPGGLPTAPGRFEPRVEVLGFREVGE